MEQGSDVAKLLGDAVQAARSARGWTIEQAAGKAYVDVEAWATVEEGKGERIQKGTRRNIALALGLPAEALLEAFDRADGPEQITKMLFAPEWTDALQVRGAAISALLHYVKVLEPSTVALGRRPPDERLRSSRTGSSMSCHPNRPIPSGAPAAERPHP